MNIEKEIIDEVYGSVWDSVDASVRSSVSVYVGDSVKGTVWASVSVSMRDNVDNNIKEYEY